MDTHILLLTKQASNHPVDLISLPLAGLLTHSLKSTKTTKFAQAVLESVGLAGRSSLGK